MREPLFRGVSKETNEWVYGFGWFKTDYTEEYLKALGKIEQDAVLYTNSGPVLCYLDSMGEWTELRDNKKTDEFPDGQMIFEGDIVEFNDFDSLRTGGYTSDNIVRGKVVFAYGGWLVESKVADYDLYSAIINDDEFEVIGNIYENPELLEGTV